ncbi:hypothetical protein KSS87_022644 [Heliosperma pusillum]|nr:hypothetical protein KSS87_014723 [Heliosperma pusillum]KAH9610097.1 hypothetical protein KSS87_003083 [Heliosperma pusillum]KAH9610102.1 hypothetical protein KSS87_021180 [Heliosperma pusillum]KAH9616622.1 hypothetical protein KSS87_022644 [Heliosperma pusillum]
MWSTPMRLKNHICLDITLHSWNLCGAKSSSYTLH